jgi:hypothetical protein
MPIVAEREIGEGGGVVYVWFYSTHRELARLTGSNVWRCKVGHTKRSALERVLEGPKTARPEPPVLGLVIHTDDPVVLESSIHRLLKATDEKWIREEGCGGEWFHTSPEEVEVTYYRVLNGEALSKTQGRTSSGSHLFNLRLPKTLMDRLNLVRDQMSQDSGVPVTRSVVVRELLRLGIEEESRG